MFARDDKRRRLERAKSPSCGSFHDMQPCSRSPKPASRQGLYVTRRVVVVMAGVRREEGRGKDASMSMGALADNGKQGRDERDEMASRSHAP